MIVAVSFTASASSAAATVTVWPFCQFEVVKVSVVWLPGVLVSMSTVTSELLLVSATVTLPVGCAASATVKVLVEPSVTVSVAPDSTRPPSSSTVTVTVELLTLS